MLPDLPLYVNVIFNLTVLLTWWLFIRAAKNRTAIIITLLWLLMSGIMGYRGFYQDVSSLPPKFIFAIVPPLVVILFLFVFPAGRKFIDTFDMRSLTIISIVRIPVELVLYWLSVHKAVPELMTFAGRNFDILAGLTAPIVYYTCFKGSRVTNKTPLLVWNILSLGLLLNIVINAVLSAPFRFQQFAFDQPNIAVLYFPFIWLPCFIVMVVLFSHLVSIRKLSKPEIKSTLFID
jgi:hypothetical protein